VGYRDVPEPTGPAAGEVLVGVEYAPINMNDLYLIQGAFPVRRSLPKSEQIIADGGCCQSNANFSRVLSVPQAKM
jgi:hypothetical protein